jgi:hypothetical protein
LRPHFDSIVKDVQGPPGYERLRSHVRSDPACLDFRPSKHVHILEEFGDDGRADRAEPAATEAARRTREGR